MTRGKADVQKPCFSTIIASNKGGDHSSPVDANLFNTTDARECKVHIMLPMEFDSTVSNFYAAGFEGQDHYHVYRPRHGSSRTFVQFCYVTAMQIYERGMYPAELMNSQQRRI